MKHIILASASPRRKEILELADLKFDVMPSDAQEITTKTAPNEVVMELASIKAKDIYKKSEKQSMVVGADTVVAYQGQILGKPADEADAKSILLCATVSSTPSRLITTVLPSFKRSAAVCASAKSCGFIT